MSAPIGRVQIFCFSPNGGPLTPAGTDVEVSSTARAKVNVFSVRTNLGDSHSDAGFSILPLALPLTVNQVLPKGPASSAGLRIGDQLVTIDGVPLQGVLPIGAMTMISNHRPGTTAVLGISRTDASQTLKIVVGNPPGH